MEEKQLANAEEDISNNIDIVKEGSEDDPDTALEGVLEEVAKTNPGAAQKIQQIITVQQQSHKGPMPSPEALASYARVQNDLPERMMTMAEKSQDTKARHNDDILALKRLELENEINIHDSESRTQKHSINLAFSVVIICILGSFYLAINDKTVVASIIGGTTLVGVVGSFLRRPKVLDKKNSE